MGVIGGKDLKYESSRLQSCNIIICTHRKIFISLSAIRTENPGTHQCIYKPFQELSQKYYENVYHCGLSCQINWMEVSKRVADELIDCWVIAKYNYIEMKQNFKELHDVTKNGSKKKKEKKLQQIYDSLLDSLVEVSDSMPPALKLHTFTKDTIFVMDEIVLNKEN